jgi:hypothetical protein
MLGMCHHCETQPCVVSSLISAKELGSDVSSISQGTWQVPRNLALSLAVLWYAGVQPGRWDASWRQCTHGPMFAR